jgi:succinyl-CoA synthetase beta subunit
MILLEGQGKDLFASMDIHIPPGATARTAEDAAFVVHKVGLPAVIKAHIASGGRGKAGLVKMARDGDEAGRFAAEMLGREHRGHRVSELLVELHLDIKTEFYMSVVMNRREGTPVFMFSDTGGINIEEIAERSPEKLLKWSVGNISSLCEFHVRDKLLDFGFRGDLLNKLGSVGFKLCRAFVAYDLLLIEINPLVITNWGDVVAADSKVEMDDNALYRHPEYKEKYVNSLTEEEKLWRGIGVTYVKLDGDIGIVASGAGLAMNTMDILRDSGMSAANFLETGGGITSDLIQGSIEELLLDSRVRGIVINLYGGVNSMLEAAKGIVCAVESNVRNIPIVAKILGNQQEQAWELAQSSGITITKSPHTEEAVNVLAGMLGGNQ